MHDDELLTPEDPRREFLSAMAAALSRYGETADSLESGLQACARTLAVEVAFFSVPTAVFVAYGHGAAMHTVLLHTRDSAIDLQALSLLDETLLDVTRGRKSAAQGLAEVRLITASPLRFPWYMRVLASGLGAAAISVFLGGGVRELTAAIPVGLAVGALSVLARRVRAPRPAWSNCWPASWRRCSPWLWATFCRRSTSRRWCWPGSSCCCPA